MAHFALLCRCKDIRKGIYLYLAEKGQDTLAFLHVRRHFRNTFLIVLSARELFKFVNNDTLNLHDYK